MALEKFTNNTRIIGRKRVVIPDCFEASAMASSQPSTPLKRLNTGIIYDDTNRLESLPQDILVRILCKVDHSDLKQLLLVSRLINEATMVAKKLHFAYSTPSTVPVFGIESDRNHDRMILKAPRQHRVPKSRLDAKKLASLAVALFASPDDKLKK